MNGRMAVFTGNANPELAKEICGYLEVPLGGAEVVKFSDGEIKVQIKDNVRGRDVFIIQPTCNPVNDNLMELLIMIDAMRRASARRITAVMPYFGYARQDRKAGPRVPISARLVADLISAAGANRVLTIDLHAGQIQGFFNIPVDNIFAKPVIIKYLESKYQSENAVVVSPDAGGAERARAFAKKLNTSIALIDKRRERPNESKVMHVVGDVKDKNAILVDDMIDTAGTIAQGAAALKKEGAESVITACVHAVLSGPAIDRLNESALDEVVITNTIPLGEKKSEKLTILSIAPLLGESIRRIHNEESVSSLFD